MIGQPNVKMTPVNARLFESIGYVDATRQLFVKFRNANTICFDDMPRFRFTGLMAAPRKDAYFQTYIKDRFLAKEVHNPAS